MKKLLVILPVLLALVVCGASGPTPGSESTMTVASPDGRLSFRLSSDNTDLLFTLLSTGKPLVLPSPLRFWLDGRLITGKARVLSAKKYSIHESYSWLGVHSTAVNDCNGMEVRLKKNNLSYVLDIRVFNEGAAFRVLVPGADSVVRVPDEGTVFRLPGESTLWYHGINGHYEDVYEKKQLAQVSEGTWVAPPATLKLPQGSYLAIV
ncbi:MAG TPA: glycoside hydrolase family 97 N-terminal domain-containing protein, partial [Puia sp.]